MDGGNQSPMVRDLYYACVVLLLQLFCFLRRSIITEVRFVLESKADEANAATERSSWEWPCGSLASRRRPEICADTDFPFAKFTLMALPVGESGLPVVLRYALDRELRE